MILFRFLLESRDYFIGPFLEIAGFDVVAGLLHQMQVKMQVMERRPEIPKKDSPGQQCPGFFL